MDFELHVPPHSPLTVLKGGWVSPRHGSKEKNLKHLFRDLNLTICFPACVLVI